jgi:hypothetical protein
MAQRGLSLDAIKDVVKYPQQKLAKRRGDNGGMVFRFSKQRGRDKVVVVAEVKGQDCWLITAWL